MKAKSNKNINNSSNCYGLWPKTKDILYIVEISVVWKLINVPIVLPPMLEEQRDGEDQQQQRK